MNVTVLLIGLLAAAAALACWIALRWRKVRNVGGVTVALRSRGGADAGGWRWGNGWHWGSGWRWGSGWHWGIGRYQGERFLWFRVLSLRRGADRVVRRHQLAILERRRPAGDEVYTLPAQATVLTCRYEAEHTLQLAMGPGPLTGFLSWLESAPPGQQLPRAS